MLIMPALGKLRQEDYKLAASLYIVRKVCAHKCKCLRRPEEDIRSPEVGIQVAVSHPMWMLDIELRSSARAICTFNHWAISHTHPFSHYRGTEDLHTCGTGHKVMAAMEDGILCQRG